MLCCFIYLIIISEKFIGKLEDVKVLVNQLYEALNVQEYQLKNEKNLSTRLKSLQNEIEPLDKINQELDKQVKRRNFFWAWAGLGFLSAQFGFLMRLTWWEYSWDIMEPITYFLAYGTAIAAYSYFVLTKKECELSNLRERWHLLSLQKRAKEVGLDINKYDFLKNQIIETEANLELVRNHLRIHQPHVLSKALDSVTDSPCKPNCCAGDK